MKNEGEAQRTKIPNTSPTRKRRIIQQPRPTRHCTPLSLVRRSLRSSIRATRKVDTPDISRHDLG